MTGADEFRDAARDAAGDLGSLEGRGVLVTGASGFLGAGLLTLLWWANRDLALRLRLVGLARSARGSNPLYAYAGVGDGVEWVEGDVVDAVLPELACPLVIHAASKAAPRDYLADPYGTVRANVAGTQRMLEYAAARPGSRFGLLSTGEVYGQPPPGRIPTPEDYVGALDPGDPRSLYGLSKMVAESLVGVKAAGGLDARIARPFNLYGPGQRVTDPRVPIAFLRQHFEEGRVRLASDGLPERAFCYVTDGLGLMLRYFGRPDPGTPVLNVGDDRHMMRIGDLARIVAGEGGVEARPGAGGAGPRRVCPDMSRARSLFGYAPKWDLERGIARTRNWVEHVLAAR